MIIVKINKNNNKIKSGKKVGLWVERFKNGNISSKGYYEYDKKVGLWKYYYVNSSLKSVGNYRNDIKVGLWKYYYRNLNQGVGRLMSVRNYKIGYYVKYDYNGDILMIKSRVNYNVYRLLERDFIRIDNIFGIKEICYGNKYYYIIDKEYNYFVKIEDDYYKIYYSGIIIMCDQVRGLLLELSRIKRDV